MVIGIANLAMVTGNLGRPGVGVNPRRIFVIAGVDRRWPHKLVKMANGIASFFEGNPSARPCSKGAPGHLKRFWDPRMRREILRWVDEHHGEGLKESVRAAIDTHRDKLLGGVIATHHCYTQEAHIWIPQHRAL